MIDKEKREKEIKKKIGDFQKVFRSEEGKAVLEDLKRFCFYDRTTFIDEGNIHKMLLLEGQRNVYLYIKNVINKKI